jgi:hypothetical protein
MAELSEAFKQEHLAAELATLEAEIKKHESGPEAAAVSGREAIKKSLQVFVPTAPAAAAPSDSGLLPAYVRDASPGAKLEIEHLIDQAMHEGIAKATKTAAAAHNPFILDAFHDALSGKLYDEFKRRGIVD